MAECKVRGIRIEDNGDPRADHCSDRNLDIDEYGDKAFWTCNDCYEYMDDHDTRLTCKNETVIEEALCEFVRLEADKMNEGCECESQYEFTDIDVIEMDEPLPQVFIRYPIRVRFYLDTAIPNRDCEYGKGVDIWTVTGCIDRDGDGGFICYGLQRIDNV